MNYDYKNNKIIDKYDKNNKINNYNNNNNFMIMSSQYKHHQ